MAYNELVKKLDHIRNYMREFYIYGFKSREDYDRKSLRSYDDEKRRMESWLAGYMGFRHTPDGKNVFISIDSRGVRKNPLFNAWKTKSFTDGDITLHFILFDIFAEHTLPLSLSEITQIIDTRYLSAFEQPMIFDESTVRKKLKEYSDAGLVRIERKGKKMLYSAEFDAGVLPPNELLHFFSEISPCGVVGSFLLDKQPCEPPVFAFKHHYIASALDSGILCSLFLAIREKRYIEVDKVSHRKDAPATAIVIPLRIFVGVDNGRQHLLAYNPEHNEISSLRIDYINKVTLGGVCEHFESYEARLEECMPHIWGVVCRANLEKLEHIEFLLHIDEGEQYIYRRLMREKRCGTVEVLDKNTLKFSADVYDTSEMIPWMRTFICRIKKINFSNKELERKFKNDIKHMYRQYGIGGGDAVQ